MDQTLHALGQILLNAIPTLLIVGFLVLFLRSFYFKPFEKIAAARFFATEGARLAAERKMQESERRVAEFEDKLRAARGEIYAEQEKSLKEIESGQAANLSAVRTQSSAAIERAKADIGAQADQARLSFDALSSELADEIAARVLQGRAA